MHELFWSKVSKKFVIFHGGYICDEWMMTCLAHCLPRKMRLLYIYIYCSRCVYNAFMMDLWYICYSRYIYDLRFICYPRCTCNLKCILCDKYICDSKCISNLKCILNYKCILYDKYISNRKYISSDKYISSNKHIISVSYIWEYITNAPSVEDGELFWYFGSKNSCMDERTIKARCHPLVVQSSQIHLI